MYFIRFKCTRQQEHNILSNMPTTETYQQDTKEKDEFYTLLK